MRIAYLNPQPVPDTSPSALQILQFAEAMAAQGHSVELVTPTPSGIITAAAILGRRPSSQLRLHPLTDHRRRWYFPVPSNRLFYWQALKWLRENRVDAVYLRNLKLAEAIFRAGLDVAVFFETHELFAQSFRENNPAMDWRGRQKLAQLSTREAFVYRRSTALIAITQALADDIRSAYQLKSPIIVAADAVDLELAGEALTAKAAHADMPPSMLYLGSLHRWKGVETLLDATALLPQGELRIAGGSAARIAELASHPAAVAERARIHFLGPIPPRDRFALIAEADICVLPLTNTSIGSRYTSPLKLFEYMAMGKPIVASDHPSIREVLVHGEQALLVAPEDPAALAAALRCLIDDPDERARLGNNARQLSLRHGWPARAETVTQWMAKIQQTGHA